MGYDLCNPGGGGGLVTGTVSVVEGNLLFTDIGTKALGIALPAGAIVLQAKVNVTVLFDGVTPTLTIGDAAQHDRLMLGGENDLSEVAMNIAECGYKYLLTTQVNTYLSIGGIPTQGQALIVVQYMNP